MNQFQMFLINFTNIDEKNTITDLRWMLKVHESRYT